MYVLLFTPSWCYHQLAILLHVVVIGSCFSLFKTEVFLIVIYSKLVLSPTCNFTPCCCYRFVLFLFKTEVFLIVIYSMLVLSPTCKFTQSWCYRFVLFFVQDRSIFNCHLLHVGVITNLQFYSMLLL